MEKKSEVDEVGIVSWQSKRLTDEQASERLGGGFTAEERARVRDMRLFCNRLTIVPCEVLGLTRLEVLVLNNNFITSLASFIGQLTALKGLHLENNLLATLPASMTNLQQLEWFVNLRCPCFRSVSFLLRLKAGPQMEPTAAAASPDGHGLTRIHSGSSPGDCGRR